MEIPVEEYSPEGFPAAEYEIRDTMYTLDPNMTEIAIKDVLLDQKKAVVLISRRLNEADRSAMKQIKQIKELCEKNDVPFIILCNASREEMNAFRKKYNLDVPAFVMDEIELKVIARSNPALMVLEKGVVKGKYPHRSIPEPSEFTKIHLK
jgi:hypothetical protein